MVGVVGWRTVTKWVTAGQPLAGSSGFPATTDDSSGNRVASAVGEPLVHRASDIAESGADMTGCELATAYAGQPQLYVLR